MATRLQRGLWCCAGVQALGLILAGWYFRNALNPDAVAYLRLASYYADGRTDLAVSGYWGPMLSWLLVPLLKAGVPGLVAARIVMGGSAIVFLFGCIAVYRAFSLPDRWVLLGAWLAAAASVYWSVQFITPDLLLAGLIGLAASRMVNQDWPEKNSLRVSAGVLWGLAYLAKAIALPLAILFVALTSVTRFLRRRESGRGILRGAFLTLIVFGVIAGPWVIVLSSRYHALTFSTTPRISHTIAGPADVDRYHPFARTFHVPEPGRITSWEEPSRMNYREWSPFESAAYAKHQARVILKNIVTCLVLLTSLNCAWLWLPIEFIWKLRRREDRPGICRADWLRPLALPALLVLLYLPFYVTRTEQRYFYGALPFLFAAVVLRVLQLARERPANSEALLCFGARALTLGALAPLVVAVVLIGQKPKIAGDCAHELAVRIQRAGLSGPVVGAGNLPGGRTGLYLAFLLNQPWYGDQLAPTADAMKRSGARLLVLNRGAALVSTLSQDPALRDLDSTLFTTASEAGRFPIRVFEQK